MNKFELYVVALYTPTGSVPPESTDDCPRWGFYTLAEAVNFAQRALAPWSALKHDEGLSGNDKPWMWVYGENGDGEHTLIGLVHPEDGYAA